MRTTLLQGSLFTILFAMVIFLSAADCQSMEDEKVSVDLFIMGTCTYGSEVIDTLAHVQEKLGHALELKIDYIVDPPSAFEGSEDEYCFQGFCSNLGVNDVKVDIIGLCTRQNSPDDYLKMITCLNKDTSHAVDNWESCATEIGLDVDAVRTCYQGDQGLKLLAESVERSEANHAANSPTIILNGTRYSGIRSGRNFFLRICNEFKDAPAVCKNIPEPQTVNLTLLTDKRCKNCDLGGQISNLKNIIPGIKIKEVDYMTPEGLELFKTTGVERLPALLFDQNIESSGEGYCQVKNYLRYAGDFRQLRIGADFDPTAEICDNQVDDNGDGIIDCDDSACAKNIECRPEIKNHLQVFTMSDCPYGRRAIMALKKNNDNFKDQLKIEVHYIASVQGDVFDSLHGQYEVTENITQLCVNKYSPIVWLDYLNCRSVNGIKDKNWEECANETLVDISAVNKCVNGSEGRSLLAEDIKLSQKLGIIASPTWIANNNKKFSGTRAETVKSNICEANIDIQGCENNLGSDEEEHNFGECVQ